MSVTALPGAPPGRDPGPLTAGQAPPRSLGRPVLQTAALAVLAVLGALRWGSLVQPAPTGRLLALTVLSGALAAAGGASAARRRRRERARVGRRLDPGAWELAVCAGLTYLALSAALALAGLPGRILFPPHLGAIAQAISRDVAALPRSLVPVAAGPAAEAVVLGAAALLLGAGGLAAASALAGAEQQRALRSSAVLLLVVLEALPAAFQPPARPVLEGAVLAVCALAAVLGDVPGARGIRRAAALVGAAVIAGMLAGPLLDPRRPIVDPRSIGSAPVTVSGEGFDWHQRYGTLSWPATGREVLEIASSRPDLWKAEALTGFDGAAWERAARTAAPPLPEPDPQALARWSRTILVTLTGMGSSDVLAAGQAIVGPEGIAIRPGPEAGSFVAARALQPGDAYAVTVYSPHPSRAELAAAPPLGGVDRAALAPYVDLPQVVATDAYAGVRAMALGLASGAPGELALIERTERFLARGYRYVALATPGRVPLARFLLVDHAGYCQQFAGAMALLLRLDGVPARVAVGFSPGRRDPAGHRYIVRDIDAHAWVEVWFPGIGWVAADPTPGDGVAGSALAGPAPVFARLGRPGAVALALNDGRSERARRPVGGARSRGGERRDGRTHAVGAATPRGSGASPSLAGVLTVALALAAAVVSALAARRRCALSRAGSAVGRKPAVGAESVAELERALRRTGRDPGGGLTLAALEHRMRSDPEAARYVRALRLARFAHPNSAVTGAAAVGSGTVAPLTEGRRAVRRHLAAGLGPAGRLRSWWALPPRAEPRSFLGRRSGGDPPAVR